MSGFFTFAESCHNCFSRFKCPALFWLPGASAEPIASSTSPSPAARQGLPGLAPLPGRKGGQVLGTTTTRQRLKCCCFPLSWLQTVSHCQHTNEANIGVSLTFSLASVRDVYLVSRSNVKNNSWEEAEHRLCSVFNLRQTVVSKRLFNYFIFSPYQLFSTR